jgi:hypothetical protein
MQTGSLERAAAKNRGSDGAVAPKLHRSPLRRSKLASNPLRALNTNTTRGRLIHDTAARLLAGVADPDNPLVVADVVALAELRVRADELRRDPATDPNVVIKLEGLVDRRMRRLGLVRERKQESAAPTLSDYLRLAVEQQQQSECEVDAQVNTDSATPTGEDQDHGA